MSTFAAPAPPFRDGRPEATVWRAGAWLVGGSLLAGLVAGELIAAGYAIAVPALALVLLPVFLWRKPEYGPTVLLVGALGVEQFGYTVGPRAGAATAQIPLFHGMGSLHINPADLLLCLLLAICVARRGTGTTSPWPRTPLAKCIYCLFGLVVLGVLVGKLHGGQIRFAFTETRPFVYLAATFVLASMLITTQRAMRAILWGLVVAIGFKAGQGLLIFLSIRHLPIRPEAVLAHEEALFFSLFLLLTLALWLFEVRGPLRTTATFLVPVVIAADLANTRRAAWLVLGVGLVVLLVVAFVVVPERRKAVGRIMAALAVVMAVYLPAFWNKTGGFAQPARAIHSTVSPSARDASSDLYRIQEDANLLYNIRQAGPVGKGFGVPIDYALPIQDISSIDPFIAYIPHNGVLYILMRMGPLGGIAFWGMLGVGILGACRLARSRDREAAVLGALAASIIVAYAFEGHTDQGFFYYRVAFVVGTLLGVVEATTRLSGGAAGVSRRRPAVRARAPRPRARVMRQVPATLPAARAPVEAKRSPEAAPAPAVARAPSAAEPRRAGARGQRRAQLAALALLPVAAGVLVQFVLSGKPRSTVSLSSVQQVVPAAVGEPSRMLPLRSGIDELAADRAAQTARRAQAVPLKAPSVPPKAPSVPLVARVVVAGVGSGSWLEVRRGSVTGPLLFAGTLVGGRSLEFRAHRLWIRFGGAADVAITLNGRRVSLQGAVVGVFTAEGVSLG